jgi:hypothetical protein
MLELLVNSPTVTPSAELLIENSADLVIGPSRRIPEESAP